MRYDEPRLVWTRLTTTHFLVLWYTTAYPRIHETPFLKRNSLFPFAESRFSQPLYQ